MDNQGIGVPVYTPPTLKDIYKQMNFIAELLEVYINTIPYLSFKDDIKCNAVLLGEAVIRIDKRKYYFSVFHKETKINENKEAALWAYWIVKFKPFSVKDDVLARLTSEQKVYVEHFNESFAIFLLFSATLAVAKLNKCSFYINPEYSNRLVYAFRYWHLNKNAFMTIADSLCAHYKCDEK